MNSPAQTAARESPLEDQTAPDGDGVKSPDLEDLEKAIRYPFQNISLLLRALTHRSHVRESPPAEGRRSNEQMEFLGDAILGFLVSEDLLARFPGFSEGRLSKLKAHRVSAAHLYPVAQKIALGNYLQLGKGEERTGGRTKKTLLVDALEALVAALYLDGGLEVSRQFVRHFVLEPFSGEPFQTVDYKSELQEFLQVHHGPQPHYVVVREQGPQHRKIFTVEVRVGKELLAQAEGNSKKAAQQAAAQMALAKLREDSFGTASHKTGGREGRRRSRR